ncbi:agamous-like MADS-box protein AGL15 isoform X2 [Daucus carota subsp. sativus]|uniref:agamous-like MADS-box protein AGL15 isoform X2 n=1 Tax=Daucus carota subsp. sativus TaxID=79200 RepID=UPI0007EFDF69|nr:PREDICTED: agamous-like MADS-box protein AGL15 isoform X2 [Daucus carota subsp. sativus]
MGRGKIKKKKIDDARGIKFSKARATLLKKAHELSVLCDAEVAVIIFSRTGQLYEFASSSVNQVLARYNKCLEYSEASKLQPEAQITSDELVVRKEEAAQITQRQTILLGYDLTELGLAELKQLEQLLNEGLLSVKERKEQMLIYEIEQARMKEKQVMLENEQLQKQIEELQSYLQTSVQRVPRFLEYSQGAKTFQETHGATGHDTIYPRFQKMQIMPENKNVLKQFEELQSYTPPVAQPVPRFPDYTQIQTSFPETHVTTSHDKFYPSSIPL